MAPLVTCGAKALYQGQFLPEKEPSGLLVERI